MGLLKDYVNMTRKPEGFMGKMMIKGMNTGHAKMADWGMDHLNGIHPERILEIGCGGGRNAAALLEKYPDAKVMAIDYSPLSVEKSKGYNREAVAKKRCVVKQGDVSKLDLPEESFELATAFETVYFWPGLAECFANVYKVLKKGGVFMVVNESEGLDKNGAKWEEMIQGMKNYTKEQIAGAMKEAGFAKVKFYTHDKKPWITVVAEK